MYHLRIKFITIPTTIPASDLVSLIQVCNAVLQANAVPFEYLFDPATDYEVSNDQTLSLPDPSPVPLDPNGFAANPGYNARFRKAQSYPGKIVVFAFQGSGGSSGGYSGGVMMNYVWYYKNNSDPLKGQVGGLLHEIGHYLHLTHTFGGNYVDIDKDVAAGLNNQQYLDKLKQKLADQIRDFVEKAGHPKLDGLLVFDGDGLTDTPPDAGDPIISVSNAVAAGLGNVTPATGNQFNPCDGVTSVPISVTFTDGTNQPYNLQPDKANIMSYFQTCDNDKHISLMQRDKMVSSLTKGNRNPLLHLAGISWPNGKIFFFKGQQYIRYDSVTNTADDGYPKNIIGRWNGWPSNWDSLDAALLWPDNKSAYFFRKDEYFRFDITTNSVVGGVLPTAQHWPGWPSSSWKGGIDAAMLWPDGQSAYFFRGGEYLRYNIHQNIVNDGPKPIAGNWDIYWQSNIDCIIMRPNGHADFFKGDQYITYDCNTNKRLSDGPVSIRGNIPGIKANFDAALTWSNGMFYFFSGPNYVSLDTVLNDISEDNVQPLSNWHLPATWPFFNAALVWKTGLDSSGKPIAQKAYFFRNDEYVQYDMATYQVDPGYPQKIISLWPNWPSGISHKIFAALMWPDGTAFLFVNTGSFQPSSYLIWHAQSNSLGFVPYLDPTPHHVKDFFQGWPTYGSWQLGLSAAIANWWEGNNGVIYFFVDDEYLKYDVGGKHVMNGYPKKIEGGRWKNLTWWNQKDLV